MIKSDTLSGSKASCPNEMSGSTRSHIILTGKQLTIDQVAQVAQNKATVAIQNDPEIIARIQASSNYIREAAYRGECIYGVTTGVGGMSDILIDSYHTDEFQNNLLRCLKTGAGKRLSHEDVRAAMLLRINSHLLGASGVRLELIERLVVFLNRDVIPHVYDLGSIGASGDLVPLSHIAGAVIGLDKSFMVDFQGEPVDSLTALERLQLPRIRLGPKEGLAMVNGTSVMAAIAANCVAEAQQLITLTLGAHALILQGLRATNQSFHPFIHALKPHPGQVWVADYMLSLLEGSQLIRNELDGRHEMRENDLIQDRYSIRCLPQYIGPIIEGFRTITSQIEIEINSANDNPLIDAVNEVSYHGGNFLGQYVGVGMDQLRTYLGLLAKHLDTQIALLVTPEFNGGLPPSLVGNPTRLINMGLKGLQITGNSIMPMITFLGNSFIDRFPTHAEQFNQNINSQGFGAACFARQSIELFRQYLAIALMFGVQSVDLRVNQLWSHYEATDLLSPATRRLYMAVRAIVDQSPSKHRPYIWNDDDQSLDIHIRLLTSDIQRQGKITQSLSPL